jgi:amidase
MTPDDYAAQDATGLATLIRRREVSAAEVAQAAMAAIDRMNPAVNAVVETYPDRARGLPGPLPDSPLAGVPFLWKDVGLGHEAGRKIENGSRLCAGITTAQDSHVWQMLRAAGVVPMGRSAAPEFSVAGTTETALYGATSNPWRQGWSAGGSSGGAAAAVASGMVPMAQGSDIAGSIRIPAAWCGTLGLKPSRGRVSCGPGEDERGWGMSMTFAQTRTIRDTAALLDILAQPQPGDPFVIPRPEAGWRAGLAQAPRRYRIGWSAAPLMDHPVDPETAAAVADTAAQLAGMGHRVDEAALAFDHETATRTMLDLWFFGLWEQMQAYADRTGRTVGPGTLEPVTLRLAEHSRGLTPEGFMAGLSFLNGERRKIGAFFARYDVWLSPAVATLPAPHGVLGQDRTDLSAPDYLLFADRAVQFAFPCNVAGLPALSLPLAMSRDGLPIGVQIAAAPAREDILLDLGQALEQARPWAKRVPPLHVTRDPPPAR